MCCLPSLRYDAINLRPLDEGIYLVFPLASLKSIANSVLVRVQDVERAARATKVFVSCELQVDDRRSQCR